MSEDGKDIRELLRKLLQEQEFRALLKSLIVETVREAQREGRLGGLHG